MSWRRPELGGVVLRGLTPMLDALFILLFALLAMSDARQEPRPEKVRIQLPQVEPGAAPAQSPVDVFSILIDADSTVHIDGGTLVAGSFDRLDAALADHLGSALPEDVPIDIVADADARHGVAVELLQHLRLRGFVRVHLLAQTMEGAGPLGGASAGGER